jgi:hypothetical protein
VNEFIAECKTWDSTYEVFFEAARDQERDKGPLREMHTKKDELAKEITLAAC